ncbi:beta-propeller fold lactonase family protein [Ructibacterium gallinarum]|uniref:Lactonase family protein n=1 Tax=Ructibacterium gallinarum TaxID=2779355 RepID=A0A9D5R953_9FIRM|nr:beta-propeller fold lactonase family protein [Ructibacterium gallinarum]MBE5040705.1 lactonase family protein [Ructibacterium gallinarum]
MEQNLYIASCVSDGGIYQCTLQESGKLSIRSYFFADRPMYMAREGNQMYILLRAPFEGSQESGLEVCSIDSEGSLSSCGQIAPTHGEVACHLSVRNGEVYLVNYLSETAVKMPSCVVQHSGSGPNLLRQEKSHPHFITITKEENVFVADLGTDRVYVYDSDLKLRSSACVPSGHGARHLAFSKDGHLIYCANELGSTVTVFTFIRDVLHPIGTYSCLKKPNPNNTVAAIRLSEDGKYLYVSNRGEDSISCFLVQGETLILQSETSCGGRCPRDFQLFGAYLVCTNELSDNVTVFRCEGSQLEKLDAELHIKTPLCVI